MRPSDKHLVIGVISAAIAVPFSSAAFAAEKKTTRKIEEVIVTAERQEASVQDTSISISAFTDQFLDDYGIRNQEDLQNFVPATTIQPYDATVRGVGRNYRALGGDPGVATYMNGVYSEDLLTATAATFWDVQRIEVLRGPQGTLYGRNAVGGAINILYKEPTDFNEYAFKAIGGNYGTNEYYGMVSGPLIADQLSGRVNFAVRNHDGVVEEIGEGKDLDSLGNRNIAGLFRWTPTSTITVNGRVNAMRNDRIFGGANGAGLVVLNEEGNPTRNTTDLVPGYRVIDTANTNIANYEDNDFYDTSRMRPPTHRTSYRRSTTWQTTCR
ncbi:MAG: TonB-dependent receptor plug domain-containing protein [Pseudomonadales bacterium]|nr:TonB-dependent receptor plug domain-containing protein [Pseudomonadales bacterium]